MSGLGSTWGQQGGAWHGSEYLQDQESVQREAAQKDMLKVNHSCTLYWICAGIAVVKSEAALKGLLEFQ